MRTPGAIGLVAAICLLCALTGGVWGRPSRRQAAAKAALTDQAVLAELNLARTNSAAYAEVLREFRKRFRPDGTYIAFDGRKMRSKEGVAAVDEAIAFLLKAKKLSPLAASKPLASAAMDHARDTGPKGMTGHVGTDGSKPKDRIQRYGKVLRTCGENISYGQKDARSVVIQLIVDDGVADRGHRVNIFREAFRLAGIAIAPHKKYGTMCVIDFAGGMK